MKLDPVIPQLEKIPNIYITRDAPDEFCWYQPFFTRNWQFWFCRKILINKYIKIMTLTKFTTLGIFITPHPEKGWKESPLKLHSYKLATFSTASVTFTEEILNGKIHFLCSAYCTCYPFSDFFEWRLLIIIFVFIFFLVYWNLNQYNTCACFLWLFVFTCIFICPWRVFTSVFIFFWYIEI